jgi:site-specific recombinase XerD
MQFAAARSQRPSTSWKRRCFVASEKDRAAVRTRQAYYHATVRFFAWVDHHKIGEIAEIEPLHVAAYIEALGKDFEKPTVKQHLAAIRMLFDWLVTGQIVATNPAHAVRGPKHVVKTGKTTVLTGEQARELLDSIDTSTLVGLRDRAVISVMTFAFARIGAVVAMRVEDYYPKGKRWWVRLHEKEAALTAFHRLCSLIGRGRLRWFGWLALPSGDCVLCVLDGA